MGDTHFVVRREGDLWTCPKCGRKFVGRNMWHACGDYSVEKLLEGERDRARQLFDRFDSLIAACGQSEVAPEKTRIAFMARVRFAGVNATRKSSTDQKEHGRPIVTFSKIGVSRPPLSGDPAPFTLLSDRTPPF